MGRAGGAVARQPDRSTGQHLRTAPGGGGGGEGRGGKACPLVHLKIPASKLTLMASRQVGTKGHFWRL